MTQTKALSLSADVGPSRRLLLSAGLGLAASCALRPAHAAGGTVRIGYQKYGSLVLLKGRGVLEQALKPLGYAVEWS